MDKFIDLKELFSNDNFIDKEIAVSGWIRTNRDSKNFGFIVLSDGTDFRTLQIVYDDKLNNFKDIAKLTVGCSIIAKGKIIKTPEAKQPIEMHASEILLMGACDETFPIQPKKHTMEFLRTVQHLRPRTNTFQAVFRIRSLAAYAIHKFFQENGFLYVHTPIITGSDAEGAGEMFKVTTINPLNPPINDNKQIDYSKDFFGKATNLTVSGQLYGETFAQAFKKIYTFGPTFRAENSNTTRHAAEFWMIEPEIAFCDLDGNMDIAENMLKFIFSFILENATTEMEFFNKFYDNNLIERLTNIINSNFIRITYTDAVNELIKHNDKFEYKISWGDDLQTEHERYLTEEIFKKPVFVTHYPKEIKAFYMKLDEDGKTVSAVDCLVPGIGEILGGSQREDDLDKLLKRMDELKLDKSEYEFYLDLRKYGSTIHSGFGLGFERLIMYLTAIPNIRDVIPYPRTVKNCDI